MANVPYVKIDPESPEVANAAFQRAHQEAQFWQAHRADYTERFPDEHIAVTADGSVVAHHRDLLEFLKYEQRSGVHRSELYSTFLMKTIRYIL